MWKRYTLSLTINSFNFVGMNFLVFFQKNMLSCFPWQLNKETCNNIHTYITSNKYCLKF